MKNLLTIYLIFLSFFLHGQQITNNNISSIGVSLNSGNNEIDLTVGELIVAPLINDSISLTGGLLEGALTITSVNEFEKNKIEFTVYPNPTSNIINIEVLSNLDNLLVEIYNSNGQSIKKYIINKKISQLDLSTYQQGIYYIQIFQKNQLISYKKIIKQ